MDSKLLTYIAKIYGFKNLGLVKKASGGYLSHNYILQSGKEKYFLKQYRQFTLEQMKTIHAAKNFFFEGGIPVILPVKTKVGTTYIQYQNRYYALFPYTKGKEYKKGSKLPKKIIISAAENLARMHLLSRNAYPKITKERLPEWDPKSILNSKVEFLNTSQKILDIINNKNKLDAFDKQALKVVTLKRKLSEKIPKSINISKLGKDHIVHGDYHVQNLFFDKMGRVTHVFDFEKTEIRPRVLEVMRSMLIACTDGKFSKNAIEDARLYLNAYNKIYPLSKNELQPALTFIHYKTTLSLWVEKEHYLNHSTRVDEFLNSQFYNLQYFDKHLKSFVNNLCRP